jgi:hypothetical protein
MTVKAQKRIEAPEGAPPADDVEARAVAAGERVRALRAERVKDALAGERFDHAALRDAEDELAALEDARGEKVRRARVAVQEAEAERVARLRVEIGRHEDARRATIEEAEALMRGAVDALARAEASRAAVAAGLAEIGRPLPTYLTGPSQATRLLRCVCAVMTKLSGFVGGGNWGVFGLSPAMVAPGDAWLSHEQGATEAIRAEVEQVA